MATTHGSASYPLLASKPWAIIVIPLAVVFGLGILGIIFHTRRRRRRKSRLLVSSDPRARQAIERDLQEAWIRGASTNHNSHFDRGGRSRQLQGGGRWVRPAASRWAWAHNVLMQSRAEEGLNELGEAPPPYDARKRDGEGTKTEGQGPVVAVELSEMAPGSPGHASGPAHVEPPRYVQGEQHDEEAALQERTPVAIPPQAVLSPDTARWA